MPKIGKTDKILYCHETKSYEVMFKTLFECEPYRSTIPPSKFPMEIAPDDPFFILRILPKCLGLKALTDLKTLGEIENETIFTNPNISSINLAKIITFSFSLALFEKNQTDIIERQISKFIQSKLKMVTIISQKKILECLTKTAFFSNVEQHLTLLDFTSREN